MPRGFVFRAWVAQTDNEADGGCCGHESLYLKHLAGSEAGEIHPAWNAAAGPETAPYSAGVSSSPPSSVPSAAAPPRTCALATTGFTSLCEASATPSGSLTSET